MKRTATALPLILVLSGCGGGQDSLAERDPHGAQACSALAQAFRDKDYTEAAISGSLTAAGAAGKANTPAIRDAVIDLAGTKAAHPQRMRAACVAEGADVPEVPGS